MSDGDEHLVIRRSPLKAEKTLMGVHADIKDAHRHEVLCKQAEPDCEFDIARRPAY